MKSIKIVLVTLCVFFVLIGALSIWIYYKKGMQYWFPGFLAHKFQTEELADPNIPKHVMILIVDHYEPTKQQNVDPWVKRYSDIAGRYKDADGVHPQWTWAMPIEQSNDQFVKQIAQLCKKGFGEIQMQLHHSHDTAETLRAKFTSGIERYSNFGAFVAVDGSIRFGFVHGNWSLDNSHSLIGKDQCGVNNEIEILLDMGCFADFTFPATGYPSQPSLVNTLYYAVDDPGPKSYDSGEEVTVGTKNAEGLMVITGPLGFDWSRIWDRGYPGIENGQLQGGQPPTKNRVNAWINTGVHVRGKPEWMFIKLYTHGAHPPDWQMLFDRQGLDLLFSILDDKMKSGHIILHYVTAREAYNIIKAAESGMDGDPGQYRSFVIKPYRNQMNAR